MNEKVQNKKWGLHCAYLAKLKDNIHIHHYLHITFSIYTVHHIQYVQEDYFYLHSICHFLMANLTYKTLQNESSVNTYVIKAASSALNATTLLHLCSHSTNVIQKSLIQII